MDNLIILKTLSSWRSHHHHNHHHHCQRHHYSNSENILCQSPGYTHFESIYSKQQYGSNDFRQNKFSNCKTKLFETVEIELKFSHITFDLQIANNNNNIQLLQPFAKWCFYFSLNKKNNWIFWKNNSNFWQMSTSPNKFQPSLMFRIECASIILKGIDNHSCMLNSDINRDFFDKFPIIQIIWILV